MQGTFLNNALQSQKAIVNCMAINEDGVMATGGDDGSLWCGACTRSSPYTLGTGVSIDANHPV